MRRAHERALWMRTGASARTLWASSRRMTNTRPTPLHGLANFESQYRQRFGAAVIEANQGLPEQEFGLGHLLPARIGTHDPRLLCGLMQATPATRGRIQIYRLLIRHSNYLPCLARFSSVHGDVQSRGLEFKV